MGLIDKAKSTIGMGDSEDEEEIPDTEGWADEVIVEDEGGDIEEEEFTGGGDESEEALDQTWDSAYDFAGDMVTKAGFTDMTDFIDHAMFYHIEKSPMYRDRIQSGVETMNQITAVKDSMKEIQGGEDMNLENKAEQIKAANEVIDGMKQLEGEDEQFMREVTGLAKEYADILKNRQGSMGSSSDTEVRSEETGERL